MTAQESRTVGEVRPGTYIHDYMPYLLARVSHLLSSNFHERLGPRGISVPVWRVLATLYDGDGMSIGQLARVTLIKQPTLTKIIDRMERDQLVERRAGASDRRMVHVFITGEGQKVVEPLLTEARDYEAEVLSEVTPEDQEALKTLLRSLINRIA